MAKSVKVFNIFCRNDEEGNPILHKITITETGAVRLHDHPELQSEVYYHLLMVQKLKGELDNSYRWRPRQEYQCPGCLQFYFSLIHKKFEKHIDGIAFRTAESTGNVNYTRADNDRIEHYLEKIREKTSRRETFNREDYWSERAFYNYNIGYWERKRNEIFNKLFSRGIDKIDRYDTSLSVAFVSNVGQRSTMFKRVTENYAFISSMSQRCSSSRGGWNTTGRKHDGYMNVSLVLHNSWWANIRSKGLAVIESEKHGKFFVLQAIPEGSGLLVDGIVQSSGTKKGYTVKTFYIEKNSVTGGWNVKRKNNPRNSKIEVTIVNNQPEVEMEDSEDDIPF